MEYTHQLNEFLKLGINKKWIFSSSELEKIDADFKMFFGLFPQHHILLIGYNEFRIANAEKLPKTRPQVLIGTPLGTRFPNLHVLPLFEIADVVGLSCHDPEGSYHSVISCDPATSFSHILQKMAKGFTPDFFWDQQIERHHLIPTGIEMAPFPITASICHSYLHKSVEHLCELFDLICPISKFHANILRKKYPNKIVDIPFGLNWASFHHFIKPCYEKSIDVSLTFLKSDSPVYDFRRNRIIDLFTEFKQKYDSRYKIEIYPFCPKEKYLEITQQSRIAINVTGINGPYNYRTIESMCSGTMLMQYEWSDSFFENSFSELFVDGTHGISFNENNFEEKLLYYLDHPKQSEQIARQAYDFLTENYSYTKLFNKLIDSVRNCHFDLPRNNLANTGYHHVDMVYYYQNNPLSIPLMGDEIGNESNMPQWIHDNNVMIMLAAKGKPWEFCLKLYQEALKGCPQEHAWIVKWNFLLISIDFQKATYEEIKNFAAYLENIDPQPFDEDKINFKYYVKESRFPKYELGLTPEAIPEYITLNLGLIQSIDNRIERAQHYYQYAKKAVSYFVQSF